jgi:DNA-binding CsgD family transcriptional regulator
MFVAQGDVLRITRLCGELEEFPVAASEEALTHCMQELCRIVGASNAFWVGGIRKPDAPETGKSRGWKPAQYAHLHASATRLKLVAQLARDITNSKPDPLTEANLEHAGHSRTALRQELVDDRTWTSSFMYNEILRPSGVEHRLLGTHSINSQAESHIGLDRGPNDRPFTERERDLAHLFVVGVPGFQRDLMRVRGLIGTRARLTLRERDVLRLLLTDKSEKEIAAELGLSWRTTHHYVTALFRKFDTRSRTGLMAQFLGNKGPAGVR